jgi:hypothetical protein
MDPEDKDLRSLAERIIDSLELQRDAVRELYEESSSEASRTSCDGVIRGIKGAIGIVKSETNRFISERIVSRGYDDIKAGRTRPWSEIKREPVTVRTVTGFRPPAEEASDV